MVANIFEDFKPPSEKILAATLLLVCPYSYQNSYVSQNSSQCLVLKFLRRWKGFLMWLSIENLRSKNINW